MCPYRRSCCLRECACVCVSQAENVRGCVCTETQAVFVFALSDNCSFQPLQWHPESSLLRKWPVVNHSLASSSPRLAKCCLSFCFISSRPHPQTWVKTFGKRCAPLQSKKKEKTEKRKKKPIVLKEELCARKWLLSRDATTELRAGKHRGEKLFSTHVCILVLNRFHIRIKMCPDFCWVCEGRGLIVRTTR